MKTRNILLLSFFLYNFIPFSLGQSNPFDFGIGVKVKYFFGFTKGSSNYTASLALGITRSISFGKENNGYVQPSYQLAVNLYAKGLGCNILKEYSVTEIDVVNSFTATTGYRPHLNEYLYDHKAFNGMTASSFLQDAGRISATIGTSFVANNHKRHQNVGYAGLNYRLFRVGYYNDATPFRRLADLNDRWWTGGFLFQFGTDRFDAPDKNNPIRNWKVQISYERFTGDVQDAYRLASRIGLPLVPAKNKKELFLNRALTSVNIGHNSGFGASLSFLGHSKYLDVQDWIHNKQGSAKHHSFAKSYWGIGLNFNSVLHKSTIEQ